MDEDLSADLSLLVDGATPGGEFVIRLVDAATPGGGFLILLVYAAAPSGGFVIPLEVDDWAFIFTGDGFSLFICLTLR